MKKSFLLLVSALAILPGCASITGDSSQTIRVETYSSAGEEVKGAECRLQNERGEFKVTTPGSVTVRKSAGNINVDCVKPEQPDGKGVAVSRANGGMWGNVLIGGGIGAIIDHNKGTAYNYPEWLKIVMGKMLTFDRRDDKTGEPSLAKEQGSSTTPQTADQKPESSTVDTAVSKVEPTTVEAAK
ncbi:hypothetical protein ACMYR3_11840 [Ampullimonas aquatilis]|uniref:hypothetical protein n=1 Tax=Ampullimonas aquatilis TaxID=1341549 RepID=UPI003C74AE67